MKKHLVNFSLIALSVVLFLGGLLVYKQYSDAAQSEAKKYSANNGDVISLSDDISLTVNKNDSEAVPTEASAEEPKKELEEEEKPSELATADCPGELLNLANWKQTLPTGKSKKPTEIFQPALADYSANPYFMINSEKNAVICRAPVNGVTTSGSGYPRSELREMKNGGKDQASWSTSSGTHTMFLDQAITAVPKKKKHVVAGQIHGSDDDIIAIRLEDKKLFVDLNGKDGTVLNANYKLGTRFTIKFVAADGQIKVYYNGKEAYTHKNKASGCYFKAGAYTQSNCEKEDDCSESNFGEVVIYDLKVNHS